MLVYRLFSPDSYTSSQNGAYFQTGGITKWRLAHIVGAAAGSGWSLAAKVQRGPFDSDPALSDAYAFPAVTPATPLPYRAEQDVTLAETDVFLRAVWTLTGTPPSLLAGSVEASAAVLDLTDDAHLKRLSRHLRDADDKDAFVDKAERLVLRVLRPSVPTRTRYGDEPLGYMPLSMRGPYAPDSGVLAYKLFEVGATDALRDAIAAQASLDYDRWRLMAGAGLNSQDRQTAANMPTVSPDVLSILRPFMLDSLSGWSGR